MHEEKTFIFAHMSSKAWGGGQKALADMSAWNVSFSFGQLHLGKTYIKKCFFSGRTTKVLPSLHQSLYFFLFFFSLIMA